MIEKIERIDDSFVEKINDLIDAVNELQAKDDEICEWIGIVGDLRKQVRELQATISKMEKVEKSEPADPYAEQRKWIGKLCKFWDDNFKITKHFGILTRIDETAIVRYEAENGFWYCACEPVKPDDDIIYKGERDENK